MQAIALQLVYDNLQIVLHRYAVYPTTDASPAPQQRDLSLRQLFNSGMRTASVLAFAPVDQICRSSHAVMHVGICSFSAGVILCALSLERNDVFSETERDEAFTGFGKIVSLFERFPGQNYGLAAQSLPILKALQSKMDASIHQKYYNLLPQADEQQAGR
jgi:hypothetical protein